MELEQTVEKLKLIWQRGTQISLSNNIMLTAEQVAHEVANVFTAGEFYYYIFNFEKLDMDYVSDSVEGLLGVPPEEFDVEKMLSFYHPDDLEKMKERELASLEFKLNHIKPSEIKDYKTAYVIRFLMPDGTTKKILHQAKVINISENGEILQVLGIHTDVTYLNPPIDNNISFIGSNGRQSYYSKDFSNFQLEPINTKDKYTPQELKIIKLISQGKMTTDIAKILSISVNTVTTHRRNILNKSGAGNTAELFSNCIREGVI